MTHNGAQAPHAGDLAPPLHAVHPAPSPAAPCFPLQWITHASLIPHGQTGAQTESGSPRFPYSGDPSAAEQSSGDGAAAPRAPFALDR